VIQFRLFGIPVAVHPVFWLTLALLGGALSGISTKAQLLSLGLFVLAGFISVLVHEMGHALTIRYFKLPTQIVLQAFGGYATHPAGVLNRLQSFLVTAAGPAIQILLGLAALAALLYAPLPKTLIQDFLWSLFGVSIIWAVLNCFPIYPLDGGRMLESILGPRRIRAVFITGLITAALLGLAAVALSQPFLAIFMGLFAWENYKNLQQHRPS
jgi:stage IV sporulation protein FB